MKSVSHELRKFKNLRMMIKKESLGGKEVKKLNFSKRLLTLRYITAKIRSLKQELHIKRKKKGIARKHLHKHHYTIQQTRLKKVKVASQTQGHSVIKKLTSGRGA